MIGMAAVALLGSCKADLLDLTPYGSISSGTMWTTENLADQGVTGIYNVLRKGRSSSSGEPAYVGLGLYQFDCFGVSSDCRDKDYAILQGNATTSNSLFSDYWKDHYEGIHRANDAIANLPKSEISDSKKARLIAESKFLRAFFYYKLNMVYKGVPVYLTPVTIEECNQGRETEAKVWEVIITDLTDCINEANLPDRYDKGNADFGRATKAAAYALRGKVYMWLKEWAKAEADFKKVGELGHKLFNGDYKALFKQANEQSEETVFSVQCIGLDGYGNDISFRYGTRSTFGSCWNTYLVSTDFVESYEEKDGSEFDWEKYLPGYTAMTPEMRKIFFLRDTTYAELDRQFAAAGYTDEKNALKKEIGKLVKQELGNAGLAAKKAGLDSATFIRNNYLPTGNEARIRQAYANRDPRLQASIVTPYEKYDGADGAAAHTYVLRWPYTNNIDPLWDLKTDTNNRYYYLFRKFVAEGPTEIANRKYSDIDFPLIRYADVLLNLAEALNEQGKTSEAIACVNLVRARAGVQELNTNAATTVSGQADLRERIRNERRWEFNGEGVNFFDELRWGTWKETKFHEGAGLKQIWGEPQYTYSWGGDHYYFWPIPSAEKDMNENLTQTKDWID